MRTRPGVLSFVLVLGGSLFFSRLAGAQQPEMQPPPPMAPPAQPGIAPPPPMAAPVAGQPPPVDPTTQRLDEAEKNDNGRKFELFWVDGGLGGSYINMRQFSESTFQIQKASAGGPMFDLGAGVRFVVFTLGARIRYNALSSFNMWQINAEGGLKVPIGPVDLVLQLHGGYSFVGHLGDAGVATSTSTPVSTDDVSIRGFNAGMDIGFDYFVSPTFSVGVGALADLLVLNRPPLPLPAGLPADQAAAVMADPLYKESGTSIGLQVAGGLRLGLHFGL